MIKSYLGYAAITLALCFTGQKKTSGAPAGLPNPTGAVARVHFRGIQGPIADTNTTKLGVISSLPETRALLGSLGRRLAPTIETNWLGLTNLKTNAAREQKYSQLLDHWLRRESYFELRPTANGSSWFLAVRAAGLDAEFWKTNLAQVLVEVPGAKISSFADGPSLMGMQFPLANRALLRWTQAGDWLVISREIGEPKLLRDGVAWSKQQTTKPLSRAGDQIADIKLNGAWFAARGGWPQWWQGPAAQWPHALELSLAGKEGTIRSTLVLNYPEPLRLSLKPWRVPTNTIRDDMLVSFTAMQSVQPWFRLFSWNKSISPEFQPDQMFVWAQGEFPILSYAALPVVRVTNLIQQVVQNLPALMTNDVKTRKTGQFLFETNRTELIWSSLPVLVPFIRPEIEPSGEFLLVGVYPTAASTNPPPPALLAKLSSRDPLVYYDWEITEARLSQWRAMGAVFDLVLGDAGGMDTLTPYFSPGVDGQKWLVALSQHLGESVTEMTQTGPKQLTLVRKSHSGLTGIELLLVARAMNPPAPQNEVPIAVPANAQAGR